MSKDIFLADYSNCEDTRQEIDSNIYFLEEIKSLLDSISSQISNASIPSYLWSRFSIDEYIIQLKQYISTDIQRYENFKPKFTEFYSQIEPLDIGLENLINNQLKFIEDNKDYNTYIAILKQNQTDETQENIYNLLISQGLPEDVAMKISLLYDSEAQQLLSELEKLDETELKKKLDEMYNKAVKSPVEFMLIEFLALNKGSSNSGNIKDLANLMSDGALASFMTSKYIGKDLSQYTLDINSLQGEINKLTTKLRGSQLSRRKITLTENKLVELKNIRNTKLSNLTKVNKFTKIQEYTGKIAKWAGRAAIAFQVYEITTEQWEEYSKNGVELDDVVVAAGIDTLGIVASAYGGGLVGVKAGAIAGSFFAPPVGTIVGGVVGLVAGVGLGFLYGAVIDPILTDLYNEVVEPGLDWVEDQFNEIGDWWDTIWW